MIGAEFSIFPMIRTEAETDSISLTTITMMGFVTTIECLTSAQDVRIDSKAGLRGLCGRLRMTNESDLRKKRSTCPRFQKPVPSVRFTITAYINAITNAVSSRFANLDICTDTTRAISGLTSSADIHRGQHPGQKRPCAVRAGHSGKEPVQLESSLRIGGDVRWTGFLSFC